MQKAATVHGKEEKLLVKVVVWAAVVVEGRENKYSRRKVMLGSSRS